METPAPELLASNPLLFSWVFAILLFVAVGSLIYHIRKSDKNNENQWTTLTDHEKRLGRVEGKCEANHS
jgi:hypothetical protein